MSPAPLHIIPYGTQALLLEWPSRIDPEINAAVLQLAEQVRDWPEVVDCQPAYCSLLLLFADPRQGAKLRQRLQQLTTGEEAGRSRGRLHHIPVCYGGIYGPDLPAVARQLQLSEEEIVRMHTATEYRVYMLGFLPGFPYLGLLPPGLEIGRRSEPRLRVPAGSVGLAGRQTGIYPAASPGGWQLIGRTPLLLLHGGAEGGFRFQAGDRVRFNSLPPAEFDNYRTDG